MFEGAVYTADMGVDIPLSDPVQKKGQGTEDGKCQHHRRVKGYSHLILVPGYALLGASGVVFAFIMLSSFTCIKEKEIPLTFILVAVLYIGTRKRVRAQRMVNVNTTGELKDTFNFLSFILLSTFVVLHLH